MSRFEMATSPELSSGWRSLGTASSLASFGDLDPVGAFADDDSASVIPLMAKDVSSMFYHASPGFH